MYLPKLFEIKDWPEITRFIKENPFATLVSRGDEYPVATHIPLELEENERGETVLSGHLARANPQWNLFESEPDILAHLICGLGSVDVYFESDNSIDLFLDLVSEK